MRRLNVSMALRVVFVIAGLYVLNYTTSTDLTFVPMAVIYAFVVLVIFVESIRLAFDLANRLDPHAKPLRIWRWVSITGDVMRFVFMYILFVVDVDSWRSVVLSLLSLTVGIVWVSLVNSQKTAEIKEKELVA